MTKRTRWTFKRWAEHFLTAILVYSMTIMWRIPSTAPHYRETSIISSRQAPANHLAGKPTTFLMGIFSVIDDSKHRQMTRSTMLGFELPEAVQSRMCSLRDFLENRASVANCQLIYTFVVGANETAPPNYPNDPINLLVDANNNISTEKDLTLLNIHENMNEGKTPSWFHYASTLSGIDYVSKLDLDTLVSMPQLLHFVNHELPRFPSPPRVFGGLLMDFESCGGKFWASRCDPAKHKPYMSGQFYFLSQDMVQHQSTWRTNSTFKHRKHEDLSFGIRVWAYPHPIKVMALNPSYFWWHGLKNETLWMDGFDKMKRSGWSLNETFFVNGYLKNTPIVSLGPPP